MKIIVLVSILLASTFCFSKDCTYQTKLGETENISLLFFGSSAELAQIQFKGTTPDMYFILSKVLDGGLQQEYSQFASRQAAKSPLSIVSKPISMIFVTHVKGGNHYKLKLANIEYQLNCVSKN